MGLIEKSMLERYEESKFESELDKTQSKPQECCCEPKFQVRPYVSFYQSMSIDKAIEEIKLAIEKNNSSLVSIEALKAIEPTIRNLIELYVNSERSLYLAMYFREMNEKKNNKSEVN